MDKSEVLQHIVEVGLVPVIRAEDKEEAIRVIDAVEAGGIPLLEITMTVPGALSIIEAVRKREKSAVVGAGTVLDAETARAVIERDDEIDQLYDRVFHDLLDRMSNDPAAAGRAARLLLVAKHFERIGDYVTDICELIVYMKEALVIKHSQIAR